MKKIVFPEGDEERILKAAEIISKKRIADVILLGNVKKIYSKADRLNIRLENVIVIDHIKSPDLKKFAKRLSKLRKLKIDAALKLVKRRIYFGMMMLNDGDADALIAGAETETRNVLIPGFQIIKHREKASGAMLMNVGKKQYLFADVAVQANPDAKELAGIALLSAKTFKALTKNKPRVAMLSYSTKGSARGADVDKVKKAVRIAKRKNPELVIDGEMQLDAAIVPEVAKKKCPDSAVKGDANVLVFPDLNSGNIGYKLVERFCKAKAVGPIIQGLSKPVNDLSRGCSVDDIVELARISVMQTR